MIYLDNAATTYPKPEGVYKALDKAQRDCAFNAGRGSYKCAEDAMQIIENTRCRLCEAANAKDLVFTSSATQALNNILFGLSLNEGDIVYCSPYDHNAIARTLNELQVKKKIEFKIIPLLKDGSIDLEKLKFECLMDKPKVIICTHVSNVTGYILPVQEIGKICKISDSIFIVDGAQAFGLVPVDLKLMNIDYYVFAGHKTMYGPFGIAGYLSIHNDLLPTFFGGTGSDSLNLNMPEAGSLRYEPSSQNVVAIRGLLEGFNWVTSVNALEHEKKLYEYAYDKLSEIDGMKIYNNSCLEHTGIISFNLEGYSSEDLAKVLDNDYDICVRGGYHCCPFIHNFLCTKDFLGTVRVSFSYFNTIEDVDKLIEVLEELSYDA